MATVPTEIEAQINSRPLTYFGAELNDLNALTPAQRFSNPVLMGLMHAHKTGPKTTFGFVQRPASSSGESE